MILCRVRNRHNTSNCIITKCTNANREKELTFVRDSSWQFRTNPFGFQICRNLNPFVSELALGTVCSRLWQEERMLSISQIGSSQKVNRGERNVEVGSAKRITPLEIDSRTDSFPSFLPSNTHTHTYSVAFE